MPLPAPNQGENRAEFISRCMGSDVMGTEYPDRDQRLAVCSSQWDRTEGKQMSVNEQLLEAIKSRQQKLTQFNRGIVTADCYVKTLQDLIGWDRCYKFAAKGNISFNDVLEKAAQTLAYSNDEMVMEEKVVGRKEYDLPKNTLVAFKHVLTTSTKDRDGDILHSEGAELDPKMLLLWQHVHTLPIGKMVAKVEQNKNKLVLVSAIVDMNDL